MYNKTRPKSKEHSIAFAQFPQHETILIQPPFVQFNTAYPAIFYLEEFFRSLQVESASFDHSIGLYRRIFSYQGLSKIFADAKKKIPTLKMNSLEKSEIMRYISYEKLYLAWIDDLVDFLSTGNQAFAHRISSTFEFPRGNRCTKIIESYEGQVSTLDAPLIATAILEDLADFIRFVLDPNYGTVNYSERIAQSSNSFCEIEEAFTHSYFMQEFYIPYLENFFKEKYPQVTQEHQRKIFLLVTIPFPGCLMGAMACAQVARDHFPKVTVLFGGGYVLTELRELEKKTIFSYCDYLCYDAGYGSILSIFENPEARTTQSPLYKTAYFDEASARIISGLNLPALNVVQYKIREQETIRKNFPTYTAAPFKDYLCPVDSQNAMHKLWSDTKWLKFHIAHGCYWRACSFCDTQLDYVANYVASDLNYLCDALETAAAAHNIYGIHFIDEALPMNRLLEFGHINRTRVAHGKRSFIYWGNMRFEKTWTPDRAWYMASAGLIAISGGIEIATEEGLRATNKGFDLASLVQTLLVLKRAGILVHSYLIYGFPNQSDIELIDSREILRQLFMEGLIDSAFWHRFVLTKNSFLMGKHRKGEAAWLKPKQRQSDFANNDLHFAGEDYFDKYDDELNIELAGLMAEQVIQRNKKSTVAEAYIASLIEKANATLDAEFKALDYTALKHERKNFYWIAGVPSLERKKNNTLLTWVFCGTLVEFEVTHEQASSLVKILAEAASPQGISVYNFFSQSKCTAHDEIFYQLRTTGLVFV